MLKWHHVDPGFPRGERHAQSGALNFLAKYCWKRHENEEKLTVGEGRPKFHYLDPPEPNSQSAQKKNKRAYKSQCQVLKKTRSEIYWCRNTVSLLEYIYESFTVKYFYWWLVRVTLVVAWWFFVPKFWEEAGTYESLFFSKMNAASAVVTCEVVGTLNHYKMVKKILNFVHLEVVGT